MSEQTLWMLGWGGGVSVNCSMGRAGVPPAAACGGRWELRDEDWLCRKCQWFVVIQCPPFLSPYQNYNFPRVALNFGDVATSSGEVAQQRSAQLTSLQRSGARQIVSWGLEGACPDSPRQGMWWDMLIKTGRCGPASLYMYI